jgi:hypothetical protein
VWTIAKLPRTGAISQTSCSKPVTILTEQIQNLSKFKICNSASLGSTPGHGNFYASQH